MNRVEIGDCRAILPTLPAGTFQTCVTSPPYFGLRDYGTARWEGGDPACDHVASSRPPVVGSSSTLGFPADGGPRRIAEGNGYHEAYTAQYRGSCGKCGATRHDSQIGLEPTPDAYVSELVSVFREVRRVLRDDGTLWLNLGDSYAGSWGAQSRGRETNGTLEGASMLSARQIEAPPKGTKTGSLKNTPGLKPKDLIGIPWRVAFALQADGWYLRSDIIWSKPNPMPESVTDRPTKAHEYLFLFAKGERRSRVVNLSDLPGEPFHLDKYGRLRAPDVWCGQFCIRLDREGVPVEGRARGHGGVSAAGEGGGDH